ALAPLSRRTVVTVPLSRRLIVLAPVSRRTVVLAPLSRRTVVLLQLSHRTVVLPPLGGRSGLPRLRPVPLLLLRLGHALRSTRLTITRQLTPVRRSPAVKLPPALLHATGLPATIRLGTGELTPGGLTTTRLSLSELMPPTRVNGLTPPGRLDAAGLTPLGPQLVGADAGRLPARFVVLVVVRPASGGPHLLRDPYRRSAQGALAGRRVGDDLGPRGTGDGGEVAVVLAHPRHRRDLHLLRARGNGDLQPHGPLRGEVAQPARRRPGHRPFGRGQRARGQRAGGDLGAPAVGRVGRTHMCTGQPRERTDRGGRHRQPGVAAHAVQPHLVPEHVARPDPPEHARGIVHPFQHHGHARSHRGHGRGRHEGQDP